MTKITNETQSVFIRNGNKFNIAPPQSLDLYDKLPANVFTVKVNEMTGQYYLELAADLSLPPKIYGNTLSRVNRVIDTYLSRSRSTGILLSGTKGGGKTLFSAAITREAAKLGMPTLVINQSHIGETFNLFIQSIQQETVIIFDEFEKVYSSEDQKALLTLLDGVYTSRKLFVLTTNNEYRIDEHMRNRPGRLFYHLTYEGLDADFIREYCEDMLENKDHIESIVTLSGSYKNFSFDVLKAFVEELNRYGESLKEVLEILNAKPDVTENGMVYNYVITALDGTLIFDGADETWKGNPYNYTEIEFYIGKDKVAKLPDWEVALLNEDKTTDDDDRPANTFGEGWNRVKVTPDHLKAVTNNGRTIEFVTDKVKLTLTRATKPELDYGMYF